MRGGYQHRVRTATWLVRAFSTAAAIGLAINPALAPELLFTTVISLVLVPFSRIHSDPRLQAVNRQTIVSHALALMGHGVGG